MEFFVTVIAITAMALTYSLLKQLISKMPDRGVAAKTGRKTPPPPPPPETSAYDLNHRAEDLKRRIGTLEEIIASEKSAERS